MADPLEKAQNERMALLLGWKRDGNMWLEPCHSIFIKHRFVPDYASRANYYMLNKMLALLTTPQHHEEFGDFVLEMLCKIKPGVPVTAADVTECPLRIVRDGVINALGYREEE